MIPAAVGSLDELAVRTWDLGRSFGKLWAVEGLEMTVPRGAAYGLLGLNGAGKSTTLRMLLGTLRAHRGWAAVLGRNPQHDALAIKSLVGYVPERPQFYDWMTAAELIAFVRRYRKDRWNDERATELARSFKIPLDQRIKTMSKGQQAKVSLLLALAFDPEMLLLDEPLGGLDPVMRREFLESLLAEYMESGRTVVISSHLVNEIAGLVDRVGMLVDGHLILEESTEDLRARVKRIRLQFEGDAPAEFPNVEGVVQRRVAGREARLTIEHFDSEKTIAQVRTCNPQDVVVEDLSLEDAFVELTSAAG
ncbi:ABC transporter ATP-binding protein [bacterium]|nr:ABC transporter ATP-binding protein [bacterium]